MLVFLTLPRSLQGLDNKGRIQYIALCIETDYSFIQSLTPHLYDNPGLIICLCFLVEPVNQFKD
jgi:hypothetical protein